MIRFTGSIELPDDPGSSLPSVLSADGDTLTIAGRTETLGSWPKDAVTIYRLGQGRFELVIGDDRVHFLPDNPAGFAAFPMVQEPPPPTKKQRKRLAKEEKRRRKMEKAQRRIEKAGGAPETVAPAMETLQPEETAAPTAQWAGPLLDQPSAAPEPDADRSPIAPPESEPVPQAPPPPDTGVAPEPPPPVTGTTPTAPLEPPAPPAALPADPWSATETEKTQPEPSRFRRAKPVPREPEKPQTETVAEAVPEPEPESVPMTRRGPSRWAVFWSKLGWQWARLLDGLRQTGIWPLDHLPALNGRYIPPGHEHEWRVVTSGVGIVRSVCDGCGLVRLGTDVDGDETAPNAET